MWGGSQAHHEGDGEDAHGQGAQRLEEKQLPAGCKQFKKFDTIRKNSCLRVAQPGWNMAVSALHGRG